MDFLYFAIVAVVGYLIGTINFSKIIAWNAKRKDITLIGSHNPGTMNMLRSFGFGLALTTFIAEIVKAGLVCLIAKLIFPQFGELIYFVAGFCLMLGNNFPVWSKFKGGKGVACLAGVFLFSSLWYVAIAWFVICFILLLFIDLGCVVSFTYVGGLSIAYTIFACLTNIANAWVVILIIWFMYAIMLAKHHENIKRLYLHKEVKVGFKDKISRFLKKKGGGEQNESSQNDEVVIEKSEDASQEVVVEKDDDDVQEVDTQVIEDK